MCRFDALTHSNEVWKEVPSKPGIMASSIGRIRLPDSVAMMPHGGNRGYYPKPTFGHVTKASKNALHTYMGISNRKYGNIKIHRLVCEAFHGSPPAEDSVVIHIDEDGMNNHYLNLKWGTQKENLNMPKFIEYCKSRTGANSPVVKGMYKSE